MGIRFSKFSNRKDNKTEVIGIVGVGRGVGTTHLGLLLANYLQGVWGLQYWNGTIMEISADLENSVQGRWK